MEYQETLQWTGTVPWETGGILDIECNGMDIKAAASRLMSSDESQ
jgi:hypothetical protein